MECAAAAHLRLLAHIGKALNLQYVTLSLDAKSILVLRHNSILVLRRHSIFRRQGGVREGNVTDLPNLTQVRHELLRQGPSGVAPSEAPLRLPLFLTHPPSLVLYFRTQ